jgi:hypothetical protein
MQYSKLNQKTAGRTARGLSALVLLTGLTAVGTAMAQAVVNPLQTVGRGANGETGAIFLSHITNIVIDDPTDVWSSGTITLQDGHQVIIPRNLVMDLPANRLTLANFCLGDQVPENQKTLGGADTNLCGVGHLASIIANRQGDGTVIAGDVFISKDDDSIQGTVTAINDDGSFVVDGVQLVKLNDPDAVHSIQPGPNNGSPDVRYTNDPSNYTFTFTTGYPVCIPNTATQSTCFANSGRGAGVRSGTASDASRFEPLQVGDHVTTEGGIECDALGLNCYQSAHTMMVNAEIATVGPIDYVLVDEAEWDINNFANVRMRGLNIGVVSDATSAVRMYRIVLNGASDALGATGCVADELIADTQACDAIGGAGSCGGQGIAANGGQVVKQNYDWDFLIGESKPERNPVAVVRQAGDPAGLLVTGLSDADNAIRVMAPIARDIIYKSSKWTTAVANFEAGTGPDPSTMATDVSGNPAQWGQYLSPNGIGHPEWNEVDLAGFDTPFMFEGINWNRDRRLGPEGGSDSLASAPMYSLGLDPFPTSGLSGLAVIESLIAANGGRNGSANQQILGVPVNFPADILYKDACAGQKGDGSVPVPSLAARSLVLDPTAALVAPTVIDATGDGTVGVVAAGTGAGQVTSHALLSADGTLIGTINNGDTLNVAGVQVIIEAVADAATTAVGMDIPGVTIRGNADFSPRFYLDADLRGIGLVARELAPGTYTLTSTPLNGRSAAGTSLTTTFTVQ